MNAYPGSPTIPDPPKTNPAPPPSIPPPSSTTQILGIDVSHYEPALDWVKAKAGGVQWMYTKATEGTGHVDAMLHDHVDAARSAGVYTGAYHFFHADQDAKVQAEFFLKTVADTHLDLPPCLDWESSSANGQTSSAQMLSAMIWLNTVQNATGRRPVIYMGESFAISLKLGPAFAQYPLWLAHYGVTRERLKIPAPWSFPTMWQYTDAQTVPGLATGHHVDADWFFGSLDDLKAFAKT